MSTQVAGGSQAAPVTGLFERYHVEVFAYLCRLVHDRQWAEDLMQETFLRAFDARGHLSQVRNRRAWLYRVASNLALDGLKRRRRFAWLPLVTADMREGEAPAEPLSSAERLARHDALEAALLSLAPAYRAPLLLYAAHGLSVAEVAEVLGLSVGAVRTRLCRAREAFWQAYAREDDR